MVKYHGSDVSVVICTTGDRLDELKLSIESVLMQSERVRELIVVWDCANVPETFEMKHQKEIPVAFISTGSYRSGVSRARNLGISKSTGEIVAILDDDDFWFPNKIKRQIEFVNSISVEKFFLITEALLVDENYFVIRKSGTQGRSGCGLDLKDYFHNIPIRSASIYIPTSSFFFHKSITESIHFDVNLHSNEDLQFIFESIHRFSCYRLSEPLLLTKIRTKNRSGYSYTGFDFSSWASWIRANPLISKRMRANIYLYTGTKRLLGSGELLAAFRLFVRNAFSGGDLRTIFSSLILDLHSVSVRLLVLLRILNRGID